MAEPKSVLVIDDEGPIRRVIEMKFRNRGYRVLSAADGEEGLALIRAQRPDVVITDIMMPKMDGKTLCEQAEGLKEEHPFLTIVITCRISPEERTWTERLRDTVLMEKPFSPSRLLERVEQYFQGEAC